MHFLADDIDALHKFHPDISINYNHIADFSLVIDLWITPVIVLGSTQLGLLGGRG